MKIRRDEQKYQSMQLILSIILLIVVCVLLSGCSERHEGKVYHVGILSGLEYIVDAIDGFKEGMTELGYVEGDNIVYDLQRTDFDTAEYQRILNKFVDDKVDLIFVFPTEASIEAKTVTQGTGIPVVFTFANIEDVDLVESVSKPGSNITGVRYPGPDIAVKRFEIMCELAPQAKRIWIPYQRGYPIVSSQLEALNPAAALVNVTLIEAPADNATELEAKLQALNESADIGIDAILFLAEPLAVTPDTFELMGKFADEHKIPVGGALIVAGEYESVFGVNVNIFNSGKQAAPLANKIFNGIDAGTIPVVSAESYFELNYKKAQELGLDVSEGLLNMADEIIQ